jgi:hypothetical protein
MALSLFVLLLAPLTVLSNVDIILENHCSSGINVGAQNVPGWPGGGYKLNAGQTVTLNTPQQWPTGGTVWGCFPNNTKCNTNAPEPPVSVIEIMVSTTDVWYDISYVSGYNIPIGLKPSNSCPPLACPSFNVNAMPSEIVWNENGKNVGVWSVCKAAWDASRSEWFRNAWGSNYNDWSQLVCCSGPYATKDACDPTSKWPKASDGTNYVNDIDSQCHDAYSYPYDDQKALKQCSAPQYHFQFCP